VIGRFLTEESTSSYNGMTLAASRATGTAATTSFINGIEDYS